MPTHDLTLAPQDAPAAAATGQADAPCTGPADATGAPARVPGISPSRANDYLQCPLLFRFRVLDRLPEPPSAAAVRGTLVHAVLERLYDEPAAGRTPDVARALLAPEWERMLAERPESVQVLQDGDDVTAWFDQAGALVDTYFTLEDPRRLEPAERELQVALQLEGGPQLRGVVDRIDVAPDGAIRIVDYKTGRSPRQGYESSALFQMRFYALVVSRLRDRVPAMLQLVYLGDGTVLRHAPAAAELDTTEQRVRAIWAGIRSAAEKQEWTPRPGPLCGWCAHQSLCPAFGGTPPQVPEGVTQLALGVTPRG